MNREDIIRLAQNAGFGDGIVEFIGVQKFELFFKAAYAAGIDIEREACAKVCDAIANNENEWAHERCTAEELAVAIRARVKK